MSDRDRHHSQPVRAVDIASEREETTEERIQRLTAEQAIESAWHRVDRHLTEQIQLTREVKDLLRNLTAGAVERSTLTEIKAIGQEVRTMRESSHVNEATLNMVTDVRDELRSIRMLLQSALSNGHGT